MAAAKQDLFSILPPELIRILVDQLDYTDGLNLSHCNRRLYIIIGQHDSYWQRHINKEATLSRK